MAGTGKWAGPKVIGGARPAGPPPNTMASHLGESCKVTLVLDVGDGCAGRSRHDEAQKLPLVHHVGSALVPIVPLATAKDTVGTLGGPPADATRSEISLPRNREAAGDGAGRQFALDAEEGFV